QPVRRHLKTSGRFWLDIFNPDLALLARRLATALDPHVFHVPRYDRTVMKTTDVRRGPEPQVQRITFHYHWFDPDGAEQEEKNEFDLTFLFPRELEILLERNGLRLEKLFGNYDASPVTPDCPRLIARCCRK